MLSLNFRSDLRPLHRAMIALGAKQVPFAVALTANALAKGVVAAENVLTDETFKSPTPFTENAYRIVPATKARPVATVAMKDIQAQYLEPYVVGGKRFLGTKKGMLAPITDAIALNRYGNLAKGKLASLKAKPGTFIGKVTGRDGKVINGVWQRPIAGKAGRPGRPGRTAGPQPRAALKLLIKFADTTPVPKRLDVYGRAAQYINANAAREFDAALRRALATAR